LQLHPIGDGTSTTKLLTGKLIRLEERCSCWGTNLLGISTVSPVISIWSSPQGQRTWEVFFLVRVRLNLTCVSPLHFLTGTNDKIFRKNMGAQVQSAGALCVVMGAYQ